MYLSIYPYTTQLYLEILHGQRYQPQKSYSKQDAIPRSIQEKALLASSGAEYQCLTR